MKNVNSLKWQLALHFAIIVLPLITILLYQAVSDFYHSQRLATSYRHLGACYGIKSKYSQFVNGAVNAIDSGQLGLDALRALNEAAEKLGDLAQEDHSVNFAELQDKMGNVLTALKRDRSISTLILLRELISQMDAELGSEYLHYEKKNRQAIEANIASAKIHNKIVLVAIVVTFLLSIMVGRLVTRSITRPITEAVVLAKSVIMNSITELARGAAPLAQEDLTIQEKFKTSGEVQMLVYSINRMAEDLGNRTRELIDAQEELVHREKLAMLGLIAGGMGNELRNPLGVMNNAVFFLKSVMPDADDTIREYLAIIEKEIANSQGIISDLLDFCRNTRPKTESITARELIEQSLAGCAIPENIRVQSDLPGLPLAINIDPKQMGQVLRNLITNAVQAMPNGGALCVAARRRGPGTGDQGLGNNPIPDSQSPIPDGFVEISITDTGAGIAPENMDKLFQPLFTTKSRGIGLGLAISQKLTEANGGRIEVESRVGEGTTFSVIMPAPPQRPDITPPAPLLT